MPRPKKRNEEMPKTIMQRRPDETVKIYKAICHTKCFWMDTLWEVNDIYEGPAKPPKHFSKDGKPPNEDPDVMAAGDDPRSTVEMLTVLKKKFGVDPPVDENGLPAKRHVVFELLRKHEQAVISGGGIKS